MADVTLTLDASPVTPSLKSSGQAFIWADAILTGYLFYINDLALGQDLVYQKTTDGGETFSAQVLVRSGNVKGYVAFPDKWVPSDSGVKINIFTLEDNPADEAIYLSLDTASDTLSSAVLVDTHSTSGGTAFTAFAKSKSGNFIAGYNNAGIADFDTRKSVDAGATWSDLAADLFESLGTDHALGFAAPNRDDNDDVQFLFFDTSALEISLKEWDESAAVFIETAIASVTNTAGSGTFVQMAGALRHSDGKLVEVHWDRKTGSATLKANLIDTGSSITALTDVVSSITDPEAIAISIDQVTNNIYVFWSDGVSIFYRSSSDGGSTWSVTTTYSEDTYTALKFVWTDPIINGGRVYATTHDNTGGPADAIFGGFTNSIALPRAALAASLLVSQMMNQLLLT
jgi:hypothetical protein